MYMEGPKSKVLVEPWHGEGGVEGEGGGGRVGGLMAALEYDLHPLKV